MTKIIDYDDPASPAAEPAAALSPAPQTEAAPPPVPTGDDLPAEPTSAEALRLDNPRTDFVQELPTTSSGAPSEGEAVYIVREMFSNLNRFLEHHAKLLETLDESETQRRLKKQRLGQEHDGNPWYEALIGSLATTQNNRCGEDSLAREGSQWRQVLEHEGVKLRPGQPKQRLPQSGDRKELALFLARKAKTGIVYDVPLYHSGAWLRLTTPPLVELATLQYEMTKAKIDIGAETKGLAFSNIAETLTMMAVDFALQYVIDSNLHYTSPADLKEQLLVLDIPALLWGLAVTLYPQGFPYSHPCLADPHHQQHVVTETLNLSRLLFTDRNALTDWQKQLMARRFQKVSEEEQLRYLREHRYGQPRRVWFKDEHGYEDIGVTLRVPTIAQHELAGKAWIEGLIDITQGAFNEPPEGKSRKAYISRLANKSSARQYAHWVASVNTREEDSAELSEVDDEDVINAVLTNVFSEEVYIEQFLLEVQRYINDSQVSLVAVPSFNCPSCNTPAAQIFHERFEHLVPLDVLSTFFIVVNLKLK